MNPAVDVFATGTAQWVRDFITAVILDPATKLSVTYVQAGAVTLSPTTGTATVGLLSFSVDAWRGVPLEQTAAAADAETRQYIILAADLPGVTPARGDFIRDDKVLTNQVEFGVDRVEDGAIGATIYYLIHTTRVSP